jgi:hypothetical protein
MSEGILKLLRYSTGSEKPIFIKFKNAFDAVLINATIAAYNSGSVADLVSIHKNHYIIDPQTYIFQQKYEMLLSPNSRNIKSSIEKYLNIISKELFLKISTTQRSLNPNDISAYIDEIITNVYNFETELVDRYLKNKDYKKYLDFVQVGPEPRFIISPYFMLKEDYSDDVNREWLFLNNYCLAKLLKSKNNVGKIAAQLVLEKGVLREESFLKEIINAYNVPGYDYLFLWIDDFDSFAACNDDREKYKSLLQEFSKIGKKVIITYGGYDSILLCNKDINYHLYGVNQSIGYGESRSITPVGGGIPTNKYYFPPLHKRMRFSDVADILQEKGFFNLPPANFINKICNCNQCSAIIQNDTNNFFKYGESSVFTLSSNNVKRNRPTQEAMLISATHFLSCKTKEWENVKNNHFTELKERLIDGYEKYGTREEMISIKEWCKIYD